MHYPSRIITMACVAAAFTASASARIERDVQKTFQVQPGVHLKVSTSGGDVRVTSTAGSAVTVTAKEHIRAGSDAEADEVLKKLDLNIAQNGNEVVASASYDSGFGIHFGGSQVQVDFIVTVPASASAELKTSGGDIKIDSVENTLRAETSGGDVRAGFKGALKGDCELSTSGGEVKATVSREASFRLDASTSGGEVNASGLTITIDHGGAGKSSLSGLVNGGGPLLKLRSSGGNVEIVTR